MQEIIVTIIVLTALWFAGKQIRGYVRALKGKEPPCKHCGGQCHCVQKGTKSASDCEKNRK